MSWTSNGFFRNTNILTRLVAATRDTAIELYKPGTLNPASLAPNVRYSGFVTSLRLATDIRSIEEVQFPVPTEDQSEGEINAAIRQIEINSPKKQLNLLLRRGAADPVKIASLWLYNRRPYYTIDLLLYFTDAAAYDVASDTAIMVQVESVGYGLLSGQDSVVFHGSVVEEGENTAPNLIIRIGGSGTVDLPDDGGDGDDGGVGNTGSTVTTIAGLPVTTISGATITNGST